MPASFFKKTLVEGRFQQETENEARKWAGFSCHPGNQDKTQLFMFLGSSALKDNERGRVQES